MPGGAALGVRYDMASSVPRRASVAEPVTATGHGEPGPVEFPDWPITVLAVPIVARAVLSVAALSFEAWEVAPARIIPPWAQILQASCFGALAFVLLRYGRHDRRAWSLGLFVLDAASTLLHPFVRAVSHPPLWVDVALGLRTDAFQAALVWHFAALFPRSSVQQRLARFFRVGTAVAFSLGVVLVVADLTARFVGLPAASWAARLAEALQRQSPGDSDWYFTLQFLSLVGLVPAMWMKLRESGPDGRRRFMWLAVGIAAGFMPLVVNTLLVTLWPWLTSGATPPAVPGAVIVLSLTAVPIAGTYAALIQRALDIRLVLRQALQYMLARGVIRLAALAPFAILILLIAVNRDRSVTELILGPSGGLLIALSVAGALAAAGRRRLLGSLDRRFFREQVDARATLLTVSEGVRHAESIEDLRDTLTAAIDAALHPESIVTAIAGSDDCLHAVDADVPPLRRGSALAQLVGGSDVALDLTTADPAILGRLAEHDRGWMAASGAAILVPLRGSDSDLLGLLALGSKASELPYSRQDRELLAAVGASGGFAAERILTLARNTSHRGAESVLDPPARECVLCGAVFAADARTCHCGGQLRRAPVPLMLGDRLRFERRIGAGGMGVVYRAVDLRLQQARAVKTLPGAADPVKMARLRREARAMASAPHANLATLHSLEQWRGVPMLVMEFLEGGTLSDRLRSRPLGPDATVALGTALCQGLSALHDRGLLHRDIKPSNIGFSADQTPKLLDFGLARLAAQGASPTTAADGPDSTWSVTALIDGAGVPGTPAYISPEVLEGAWPVPADDLWSLAVTLLEACAGENPFRAPSVAATVARVLAETDRAAAMAATLPPELGRVFAQFLGPRTGRPTSAEEFARSLTHCTPTGG